MGWTNGRGARQFFWFGIVAVVAGAGPRHASDDDRALSRGDEDDAIAPTPIQAATAWAHDFDFDGLPDEIEYIFGTNPLYTDSDGDGSTDIAEWMMWSEPTDIESAPQQARSPGIRSHAYQVNDSIRVFVAVFPVNFFEGFHFYFGSPEFNRGMYGDAHTLWIQDFTSALPNMITSSTFVRDRGMSLFGVTFDIPISVVDKLAPLSLAFRGTIDGTVFYEQISLLSDGGSRMMLSPDTLADRENPESGMASFSALPLDTVRDEIPGGDGSGSLLSESTEDDPQYCQTSLTAGASSLSGGASFTVSTAQCVPDGLLYCTGADCSAMAGQSMVFIDYGWLQSDL